MNSTPHDASIVVTAELEARDDSLLLAEAALPTKYGELRICAFHVGADQAEHVALVKGIPSSGSTVPVYLHLECLIGHSFGAFHCQCRERLEESLQRLAANEVGVLLYLRHGPHAPLLASLAEHGRGDISTPRTHAVASALLRALGAERFVLA